MTDLELIERLEKATGPDREFDEAIARLAGWYIDGGGYTSAPRFTASIDAALTLVPKGFNWSLGSMGGKGFKADLHHIERGFGPVCIGVTAPIAICIAAIKARAALFGSKGK